MTVSEAPVATPVAEKEHPWRKTLVVLAIGMVLWAAILNLLAGLVPPVLVMGLLFVAGIVVMRRWPRKAGPILLIVASLATLAGGAPFAIEAATHPESPVDFLMSTVIPVTIGAGILVAAAGALLRWPTAPRRAVGYGVPAVLVVLAAVSIAAAVSLEDELAVAGDVEVITEDIEFGPDLIGAASGTVAVFVDNKDPIRHTFTIEELGVSLEIPANTARRIEFQAAPGTYEFFCDVTGHEDMVGELQVTG